MEGEPAGNSSASPANAGLPGWVQTVVTIIGSATALLVAVLGIIKVFHPDNSASTGTATNPSPITSTSSSTSSSSLQSEAEEIAKELFAGNYDIVRTKFSAGLSASLSVQMMQQASQTYITPLGNLKSTHPQAPTIDPSGQTIVNVVCNADNGNLLVNVIYDQQGKVNGLWVRQI